MELSRFQIADYNADVGTLSVRIAKGGKVRHVILTEEASDVVDRLVAGRSPEEPLLRRDNGRAWKRAEQVRAMREACARRYRAGGRLPRVAAYPWLAARHAGGAHGGDCPPARPRRHPHDREALRAFGTELHRRYDQGEFSAPVGRQ
jgi:integrase